MDNDCSVRTKVFISYATEDRDFAYWINFKLQIFGYNTWIDKENLLGGESFVSDIDSAIKKDAYCLISIISKNSIDKSAPRRERTLAASLGKELKRTFLIPILLEPFKTSELSWDISDLSHISFANGWADGLLKLNKKLDAIDTPKQQTNLNSLANEIDCRYFEENNFDFAWSNLFKFTMVPNVVWRVKTSSPYNPKSFPRNFPFWRINDNEFFAFDHNLPSNMFTIIEALSFEINPLAKDIHQLENARKVLLNKLVSSFARSKGMYRKFDTNNVFYIPYNATDKNIIYYTSVDDKATWLRHSSERHFNKTDLFNYHLSFSSSVVELSGQFFLRLTPNFVITDHNDKPIATTKVLSRRKKLCKMMFNKEWLQRLLAISSFLFGNKPECFLYEGDSTSVKIESRPLKLPITSGEAYVSKGIG
jgi:hypothetical protein